MAVTHPDPPVKGEAPPRRRTEGRSFPVVAALACAVGLLGTTAVKAAGGHHAVDDAAIMTPGNCKVEGWLTAGQGGGLLLHAGTGCRVGTVEVSGAAEHVRTDDQNESAYGVQAKWATELQPGLAVGLSLAGGWLPRTHPRYQGISFTGLVTWVAREDLALHLNLGRDVLHGAADQPRWGAALEWTATPGWTLLAERFVQSQTQYLRGGLRWAVTEAWTIDVSRAHSLGGRSGPVWTMGTSWQWQRR